MTETEEFIVVDEQHTDKPLMMHVQCAICYPDPVPNTPAYCGTLILGIDLGPVYWHSPVECVVCSELWKLPCPRCTAL